jgi:hypothetical protein
MRRTPMTPTLPLWTAVPLIALVVLTAVVIRAGLIETIAPAAIVTAGWRGVRGLYAGSGGQP